ncbi:MAG: hypothetical protein ACSHX6_07175 [Akkermansiaceae bacterium]
MKKIIPTIACTSILLATGALCHELIIAKSDSPITNTKTPTKEKLTEDQAITTITHEILEPLRQQSQRSNRFSRVGPRPPNVYHLVETHSSQTKSDKENARFFNILVHQPKRKQFLTKEESLKVSTEQQKLNPSEDATIYLNIKHLTESNKTLIKQNDKWVEKSEHNYLKLLPKIATKK